MMKLIYKPVSLLVSVLGGMLAGAIFKQVWKLTAGEQEAPEASDIRRGTREVLIAATIQGAIFALVKAALDRGAAEVTLRLTGVWPGTDSEAGEPAAEA
jgi:predicted metal-dependent enzyme (double-stranded beta helix superfamily)